MRGSHAALFGTSGGELHCVIATGTHDLVEAAPEVRQRRVNAFEDMLAGLGVRFQVLLTSRLASAIRIGSPRLDGFAEELAARRPAYAREAHIVLSDGPSELDRLRMRLGPRRAPATETGENLLREAAATIAGLGGVGVDGRLLDSLSLDRFLDASLPACIARGTDCEWDEAPDRLRLDGLLRRGYFLDAFPGVALEPGWLGTLIDIQGEYDLYIHGMRVPAPAALRQLNLRIRNLQAARLADSATHGIGDPLAEAGLPEAIGLRRELAANQQAVFLVSLTLTIRAPDAEALDRLAHAVEEVGARSLARLLPATLQMAAATLTTLPLGIDAVGAQRLLPGAVVATTYPWLWEELQQPGGRLVGIKLRGGAPVLLDTFDEGRFHNANVGVFGHSGAGKTYLVKSILRADVEAGMGAFIIDPESEYRDACDDRRPVGGTQGLAAATAST